MSSDPETTRIVRSWLDEGVTELPGRVLDAVLDELPATPQRRVTWWPARRISTVNSIIKFGLAAAVVVVAALIGINYLGGGGTNVGGPGVEPTPTPEASLAEPTATPEPSSTPWAGLPEGPFEFEDNGVAMTVTIPASGWTFTEPTLLVKGLEVANLPEAGILFWAFPDTEFYVYGDPCRSTSTRPDVPATTVDEIAAALAAQASRDASEPVDVTVGGYAGKSITLHVPDDAMFDDCEEGEFVMYGTEEEALARYHQGPAQIDELWILEVDGTIVIIDATYRPDTPEELVEEMRSIAESTTFAAP